MRRRYSITFVSAKPLDCRLAMLLVAPAPVTQEAIRAYIEERIGARVTPIGDRALEAQFTEPLELVVAAHELADEPGLAARQASDGVPVGSVRGIAASVAAHELLADAKDPTASAWRWLLDRLGLRSTPQGGFVAAVGASSIPGVDRSMIAIQFPMYTPGVWSGQTGPPITRLFDQDRIVVGRADGVDIQLIMDMVSRKHCQLERRGREWFMMDTGSAGGTYFEGNRVHDFRLATGDRFEFRSSVVEVVAIL